MRRRMPGSAPNGDSGTTSGSISSGRPPTPCSTAGSTTSSGWRPADNSPGDRKEAPGAPAPVSELYAIQMAKLGFEQDRLEMALEAAGAVLEWLPGHSLVRAMLASARIDLGDDEGALQELHLSIDSVPRSPSATYAYLSEVASALGDAQLATLLYDRLRPFAGLAIAAGQAAHCPGSVDRYLGQLAMTCTDWDDAEEHLRVACGWTRAFARRPCRPDRYWYGACWSTGISVRRAAGPRPPHRVARYCGRPRHGHVVAPCPEDSRANVTSTRPLHVVPYGPAMTRR